MADHTEAMFRFCDSFFAQLRESGVDHVVVSPGARSTPLVVGADRAGLRLWVQLDERSAAFFALGLAKGLRAPVGLICTSGTAAANYLPAVIEAGRAGVPLIALTADRPPELRGWGSNQTIDQVGLYGSATRWSAELPVASEVAPDVAQRFAARAAAIAVGRPAGPVHLNFPFREPLTPGDFIQTPAIQPDPVVEVHASSDPSEGLVDAFRRIVTEHDRGVILAGAVDPGSIDVADALAVSAQAGWPILAEPTSQLRVASPGEGATVVSTASYLVQHEGFASANVPDAVVLTGAAPPQRSLRRWLEGLSGARIIVVGDDVEWADESFTHTDVFRCDPGALFHAVAGKLAPFKGRSDWVESWQAGDAAATAAINRALIDTGLFEGRVVTALAGALPDEAALYVGNSMSVRDVNLFWPRRDRPLDIYSNRGASGIDGVVSSALGVAATGRPVVLLLGDLSLLHDLSGLLAAVRLGIPLVTVVTNNNGGGIFSFLPLAPLGDSIRFADLFHTPHGADLAHIVSGFGVDHRAVSTSTDLQAAVLGALESTVASVIEVQVDAADSVTTHREVDAAVRDAVSALQ